MQVPHHSIPETPLAFNSQLPSSLLWVAGKTQGLWELRGRRWGGDGRRELEQEDGASSQAPLSRGTFLLFSSTAVRPDDCKVATSLLFGGKGERLLFFGGGRGRESLNLRGQKIWTDSSHQHPYSLVFPWTLLPGPERVLVPCRQDVRFWLSCSWSVALGSLSKPGLCLSDLQRQVFFLSLRALLCMNIFGCHTSVSTSKILFQNPKQVVDLNCTNNIRCVLP